MPIVREHMRQAQDEQKHTYNRSVVIRVFQPGDRVLVLVPTVESKFLATWQGPYEIIERVGQVNYKVHQPGRRKPEQIYHVNLLKAWKDREVLIATEVKTGPIDTQPEPKVQIAEGLTLPQKLEVRQFLWNNRDVFSPVPGKTNIIEHEILTIPGKRVNLKPYRIPEARREAIRLEIKRMLEFGVIEESLSEWSSPIVLVPKPDGTEGFVMISEN